MIKPRENLENVAVYKLPGYSRRDKIRLDLNENTRGCTPSVLEAIRNVKIDDISIYPEYERLKEKIAENQKVDPENILLTNGADEAIRCVMETYLDEADEVLVPAPAYSMFTLISDLKEAKVIEVRYSDNLSFPVTRIVDAITNKTKMIVTANPSSPIGTSIKVEELMRILEKATNSIVILDETYYHFSQTSFAHLIKNFDNLVVIHSFSKALGLAGLRLGYIISDKRNIENLNKVVLPFSVNSLAVVAGCAALEDTNYLSDVIFQNNQEKKYIADELQRAGIEVRMTDTNFLLVNVGEMSNKVCQKLYDRGILVKNLNEHPGLSGYLRVTVGTHGENLVLVEVIKDALPPQAIVFDLDGVLVDVSNSYRRAIKATAEHYLKTEITFEKIDEYKLKGGYNNDWELTEAIIKDNGQDVAGKEVVNTFQNYYLGKRHGGFVKNEEWLLDTEILKRLKQSYKLGIVTGRPRREAEYALKRFKVKDYFDVLITMDDVQGQEKPDPSGIKLALERLAVKRAFFVGDNVDDIKSAVQAKVTAVGIAGTPDSYEGLLAAGSRYILNSVSEIRELLR